MNIADGLDIARTLAGPRAKRSLELFTAACLYAAMVPSGPVVVEPFRWVGCQTFGNMVDAGMGPIRAIGERQDPPVEIDNPGDSVIPGC